MVVREDGGYQYATKRALDAVKSKRANLAAVQEGSRPGLLSLHVAELQARHQVEHEQAGKRNNRLRMQANALLTQRETSSSSQQDVDLRVLESAIPLYRPRTKQPEVRERDVQFLTAQRAYMTSLQRQYKPYLDGLGVYRRQQENLTQLEEAIRRQEEYLRPAAAASQLGRSPQRIPHQAHPRRPQSASYVDVDRSSPRQHQQRSSYQQLNSSSSSGYENFHQPTAVHPGSGSLLPPQWTPTFTQPQQYSHSPGPASPTADPQCHSMHSSPGASPSHLRERERLQSPVQHSEAGTLPCQTQHTNGSSRVKGGDSRRADSARGDSAGGDSARGDSASQPGTAFSHRNLEQNRQQQQQNRQQQDLLAAAASQALMQQQQQQQLLNAMSMPPSYLTAQQQQQQAFLLQQQLQQHQLGSAGLGLLQVQAVAGQTVMLADGSLAVVQPSNGMMQTNPMLLLQQQQQQQQQMVAGYLQHQQQLQLQQAMLQQQQQHQQMMYQGGGGAMGASMSGMGFLQQPHMQLPNTLPPHMLQNHILQQAALAASMVGTGFNSMPSPWTMPTAAQQHSSPPFAHQPFQQQSYPAAASPAAALHAAAVSAAATAAAAAAEAAQQPAAQHHSTQTPSSTSPTTPGQFPLPEDPTIPTDCKVASDTSTQSLTRLTRAESQTSSATALQPATAAASLAGAAVSHANSEAALRLLSQDGSGFRSGSGSRSGSGIDQSWLTPGALLENSQGLERELERMTSTASMHSLKAHIRDPVQSIIITPSARQMTHTTHQPTAADITLSSPTQQQLQASMVSPVPAAVTDSGPLLNAFKQEDKLDRHRLAMAAASAAISATLDSIQSHNAPNTAQAHATAVGWRVTEALVSHEAADSAGASVGASQYGFTTAAAAAAAGGAVLGKEKLLASPQFSPTATEPLSQAHTSVLLAAHTQSQPQPTNTSPQRNCVPAPTGVEHGALEINTGSGGIATPAAFAVPIYKPLVVNAYGTADSVPELSQAKAHGQHDTTLLPASFASTSVHTSTTHPVPPVAVSSPRLTASQSPISGFDAAPKDTTASTSNSISKASLDVQHPPVASTSAVSTVQIPPVRVIVDFNAHSPFARVPPPSPGSPSLASQEHSKSHASLTTSLSRNTLPVTDAPEIDFFSPNSASSLLSPQMLNGSSFNLHQVYPSLPSEQRASLGSPSISQTLGSPSSRARRKTDSHSASQLSGAASLGVQGSSSPMSNLLRSSLAGIMVPEDDYIRRSSPSMTGGSRDDVLPPALQNRIRDLQALQLGTAASGALSSCESSGSSATGWDDSGRRGDMLQELVNSGLDLGSGIGGPPPLPHHLSTGSLTGTLSSSRMSRLGPDVMDHAALTVRTDFSADSHHDSHGASATTGVRSPTAAASLPPGVGSSYFASLATPFALPHLKTSSPTAAKGVQGFGGFDGGERDGVPSQPTSPSKGGVGGTGSNGSGTFLGMPRQSPSKPGVAGLATSISFGRTHKPLSSLAGLGLGNDMDQMQTSGSRHSANSSNSNINSSTQSVTIQKFSSAKVLASSRALAEAQAHKQMAQLAMQHSQQAETSLPQNTTRHTGSPPESLDDDSSTATAAATASKIPRKSSGTGIGSVFASAMRRLSVSGPDSSGQKGQGLTATEKQQQLSSNTAKPKDSLGGGASFKALRGVLSFKGLSSASSAPTAPAVDPDHDPTATRGSMDQSRPSLRPAASARVSSTNGKDLEPGSARSSSMRSDVRGGLSYGLVGGTSMQTSARAMTKAMSTLGGDDFQTSSDEEPAGRGGYQPAVNHRTSANLVNKNQRMIMHTGSIKRITTSDDEFD